MLGIVNDLIRVQAPHQVSISDREDADYAVLPHNVAYNLYCHCYHAATFAIYKHSMTRLHSSVACHSSSGHPVERQACCASNRHAIGQLHHQLGWHSYVSCQRPNFGSTECHRYRADDQVTLFDMEFDRL